MSIEVQRLAKRFGAFVALDDLNFKVNDGELVALLGPSGCGKTTLLRIIAGLESADTGTVLFDGDDAAHRSAKDRSVGFVFQHYALFRHMTVTDNIAFGLRVRPRAFRPSDDVIDAKVGALQELVQLAAFGDRYPAQLSGGQRQRVALARALAVEPRVLLLDEPFGALDANVRRELRRWLRRLHDEIHLTSVFVTHDQEEALEVADRVVIMNKGRIEQEGTPAEVLENPATPFVMGFLGHVNIFHGRVEGYARPYELDLGRAEDGVGLWAKLTSISVTGALVNLELIDGDNNAIRAEIGRETHRRLDPKIGERLYVRPQQLKVF